MIILNLGCGVRTSDHPHVVNIDWSVRLTIRSSPFLRFVAPHIIGRTRLEKSKVLASNIRVHDMRKGIPYSDGTVDAVYHSHFMEHITREDVPQFIREVKRVLRPGGIHRIVVPCWESLALEYLSHVEKCKESTAEWPKHDRYVADMIEQCVRGEAAGTKQQSRIRRFVENMILGDARRRGETHRWMYDRYNLGQLLLDAGFRDFRVMNCAASSIVGWQGLGLDVEPDGSPYRPGSLYLEAIK